MIIYQNTINYFIEQCDNKKDELIAEIKTNLLHKMGRGVSNKEERSWRTTLIKFSNFLKNLEEKNDQYILLEFKVPLTQKRIDVILVGSDGKKKSLLIIELKGWKQVEKGSYEHTLNIMGASYGNVMHPNYEALEYKELLTERYSDINHYFDNIDSISLLPNYELANRDPIKNDEFDELLEKVTLYTKSDIEEFKLFISEWFNSKIKINDVEFLNKLEYKPTKNFQKHLEDEFKAIKLSTSQKLAFNIIKQEIDLHIGHATNKKLITISGLPGSGKTIVAFKVLAYIYAKQKMTAKLQLPGPEFRDAVKKTWGNNSFNNMIGGAYSKSEAQIVIVDEAHKAYGHGTCSQFYYELFSKQNFVIALIDDRQVVNKKGYLKKQVIDKAQEKNFDIIELKLNEQFRNAGDASYVDWLSNWIFKEDNQQQHFINNYYHFKVLDDLEFNKKYKNYYSRKDARMVSFWTQGWNAKFENSNPVRAIKVGSENYVWNPNNYWEQEFNKKNPNQKLPKGFRRNVIYKNFNKDKKGYEYIAYFNTIQGYEFDYIFVHVPKLFFLNKNNELDVDLSQLDMYDMKSQVWTKNKKPDPSKEDLNKEYFKNRLLVNLTRGREGTFIYCEDQKLSTWLKNKVSN